MKKVSIFPSSKQRFFSLFAAVFLLALLATPIFAATVTPSDEASDSSEQTVIDNVKKALQEKKDEIKDLGSNQRRQAYLAKITRLTEETLTVQTTEGNKIIPLSDAMAIRNFADQKNLELSKLAVDDWIAVYGNTNNGIFTPDRIVLYEDDYSPKEHKVMLGSISEIYSNSLAITPRGSDEKIRLYHVPEGRAEISTKQPAVGGSSKIIAPARWENTAFEVFGKEDCFCAVTQ